MKKYSHSELVTFINCPRKYAYAYIDKLELRKVYFPFILGTCMHLAITSLYRSAEVEEAVETVISYLHNVRAECSKEMFIQEKDEIEFTRTETILGAVIPKYYDVYRKEIDKFELLHADEIIESKLFRGVVISGHPDMILRRKSNNKIYIYEIKTASNISKEMIDRYFYDFQTNLYILLVNPKYNIAGVYFDAVKKPGIKLKQAETERLFLSRLHNYYVENPEDDLFYRDSYKKNEVQLNETIKTVKYIVYNLNKLKGKQSQDYPMNRLRCYDFFSTCEYALLCNSNKSDLCLKTYVTKVNNR